MKNKANDKYALLLRLNPNYWPLWEQRLFAVHPPSVWFETSNCKLEDIKPGIPAIVLGTDGIGIVAEGTTKTGIETRFDPDWEEGSENQRERFKEVRSRVCVKLKGVKVPLAELKKHTALEGLHKRRKTTTWLKSEQYSEIMSLIQKWRP